MPRNERCSAHFKIASFSKICKMEDIQMEDSLNTLSQTVEQIQESQNHLNIEKKQHLIAMQQELERQEREWKVELNQLNQVSTGSFSSKKSKTSQYKETF